MTLFCILFMERPSYFTVIVVGWAFNKPTRPTAEAFSSGRLACRYDPWSAWKNWFVNGGLHHV